MNKHNLPVYAIVELLMRLEKFKSDIGDYKNHSINEHHVKVKTSSGTINFPKSIIMKQFEHPDLITNEDLTSLSDTFQTAG
jgi:hypothetical protein